MRYIAALGAFVFVIFHGIIDISVSCHRLSSVFGSSGRDAVHQMCWDVKKVGIALSDMNVLRNLDI